MTATRCATIDPDEGLALPATLEETLIDLSIVGVLVVIPLIDKDFILNLFVGPAYSECQISGSHHCRLWDCDSPRPFFRVCPQ